MSYCVHRQDPAVSVGKILMVPDQVYVQSLFYAHRQDSAAGVQWMCGESDKKNNYLVIVSDSILYLCTGEAYFGIFRPFSAEKQVVLVQ